MTMEIVDSVPLIIAMVIDGGGEHDTMKEHRECGGYQPPDRGRKSSSLICQNEVPTRQIARKLGGTAITNRPSEHTIRSYIHLGDF